MMNKKQTKKHVCVVVTYVEYIKKRAEPAAILPPTFYKQLSVKEKRRAGTAQFPMH